MSALEAASQRIEGKLNDMLLLLRSRCGSSATDVPSPSVLQHTDESG
jgi:hypothetical protein